MDSCPGNNLIDLQPLPKPPSDISCSSGPPSVVSTRDTSPASSIHRSLDTSPSGAASFEELPDRASRTPGKALEMNHEPSQAVDDRRSILAHDLSRVSHASPGVTASSASNSGPLQQATERPPAPNAPPHPSTSFTSPTAAFRGLYCRNWRSSTASLDSLFFPSSTTSSAGASSASCSNNSTSTTSNNTFSTNLAATSGGGSILSGPVSPVSCGNNLSNSASLLDSSGYLSIANVADEPCHTPNGLHGLSDHHRATSTSNLANMHPTNGAFIAEADMDRAMGYCYDRGDGQYTRLVAVDLLPIDLRDIPRRVASDEGLIVLPVPRMPGPNGQPADSQLEVRAAVTPPPSSPSDHNSADVVQTRIDTIVASSPQGATSPGAVVLAVRSVENGNGSAVVNRSNATRRDKIYCDKWIHDGTCAFTQQGCKFKHEMPNDKETQEKLGLFHGYPVWWKKLLAEQQRPMAIDDRPVSIGSGRGGGASSGTAVGPAYTSAWRPIQHGPGHPGESVEDVRHTGLGAGGGSGGGGRGAGSFGSRGGSRQGRGGAPLNGPNYGPIGPPSRLGRATGRATRVPAGPSSSNNGFGAARASLPTEANAYAALMDLTQDGDGDAGGDTGGDTVEDEEPRGAKL